MIQNIFVLFLFPVAKDISTLMNLTPEEVNAKDEDGETWLMKAAQIKDTQRASELIQLLISKGTDVNITSSHHHYTALWHAVNTNCRQSVEILLRA